MGAIISGCVLGAIYGLLPIFGKDWGLDVADIALMMGLTIVGGLILQWPLGLLSDRLDRRKILFFVSLTVALLSLIIAFINGFSYALLLTSVFIFGGFTFTINPLSVTHTSDTLEAKDIIAALGSLIIAYGIGAIIGPILASYAMTFFGYHGLFYYFAIIDAFLAGFIFIRIKKKKSAATADKVSYRNLPPRTTPILSELDPRSEEKKETQQ